MINELIYVFCISNNSPGLLDHLKSGGINFIVSDDFCAIVKYVSNSEFSEENFRKNLSDIQWVESNAREHINVISRVMEFNTVIPFKFGTIYNSEDGLKKFITDYSGSLAENIHNISGKEEWSVKIYCNRRALSSQIDKLSEEAAELEKQIFASSPGKAFLLKRKKSDLIENEMDQLCKTYGQKYFEELKNLSDSISLNKLLPKEFTGREDSMILNATFLISKDKLADFTSSVSALKKKDENSGFFIETIGPWPPFSFISIKEK